MRNGFSTAAVAALVCLFSLSATFLPPGLKWRTVETQHFYIHYYDKTQSDATWLVGNAEKILSRLSSRLNWEPSLKIHVVLLENYDDTNGIATVFPRPVIYIDTRPPFPSDSIGYYSTWLETVFVHELVHILTLDQVRGISLVPRYILGRLYFPNFLMPDLLIEGIATYYESEFTGFGRVKHPFSLIFTRTLARERFSLAKSAGQLSLWPDGLFQYLSGSRFIDYLSSKYGEKTVSEFFERYSRTVPFFANIIGYNIWGYTLDDLWRDFQFHELENAPPETHLWRTVITRSGFYKGKVKVLASYGAVLFYGNNGSEYPGLYLIDANTGKLLSKWDAYEVQSLSAGDRSNSVIFTAIERKKTFYTRYDIYELNLDSSRVTRLTKGSGVETAVWLPPSHIMVGTRRTSRGTEIFLFSKNGDSLKKESSFTVEGVELTDPSVAPDGQLVAYTCKIPNEPQDICVLDVRTQLVSFVTRDRWMNRFPVWTQKGIYFTSSRNGSFYLYLYVPEEGKYYLVGGDDSGIYEFDIDPAENEVFYTCYTSRGYEICRQDLKEEKEIEFPKGEVIIPFLSTPGISGKAYSSFKSLRPLFWYPYYAYSSKTGTYVSARTFNWDVLLRYFYYISVGYQHSRDGNTFPFSLLFGINRFYPTVALFLSHVPPERVDYTVDGEARRYWQSWLEGGVLVGVPYLRERWFAGGRFYYLFKKHRSLSPFPEELAGMIQRGWRNSVGVNFTFDSRKFFRTSIAPQSGMKVSLFFKTLGRYTGSDVSYSATAWELAPAIKLPGINVFLQGRLLAGAAWGPDRDRAFETSDTGGSDELFPDTFTVRGYSYSEGINGSRMASAAFSILYPFYFPDTGIASTFPLFFRVFYLDAFYESAVSFLPQPQFIHSVGGGINVDLYLAYHFPFTFSFHVAKPLKDVEGVKFYLSIGFSSPLTLWTRFSERGVLLPHQGY